MKTMRNLILVGVVLAAMWGEVGSSKDAPNSKDDGILHLHGTVRGASTNGGGLRFEFKGRVQFAYFTAPSGDAARKRVIMDYEIKSIPVSITNFGQPEYETKEDPFVVNFKNAVQHALLASQSGESVTIGLFRPKLSFATNGTLNRFEAESGRILPDRLLKELRSHRVP